MDIEIIHQIAETVAAGGIKKVVLEVKHDTNEVFISGIDDNRSVVAFSEIPNDGVLEKTMGINALPVLLDRLSLFNLDKVKIQTTDMDENHFKCLVVTEGKKRIQYTFAHSDGIDYPKGRATDEIFNEITLNKEKVEALNKAIQATGSQTFTLRGDGTDVFVEFFDGNSDTFTDVVGTNDGKEWSQTWLQQSVMRLVKQALKSSEEVVLRIGKRGPMYIDVDGIEFMVLRHVEGEF